MQESEQNLPIQIYFYTLSKENKAPQFLKPQQDLTNEHKLWQRLLNEVLPIIHNFEQPSLSVAETAWKNPNGQINNQPKIIILFLKMEDLSSIRDYPNTPKKLTQIIQHFRKTALPDQEALNKNSFDYQPMITIGLEDIMSLYSKEDHPSDFRRDLNLDHRIKYLDSSIWNRYIPLYSKDKTSFEDRFKVLLKQVVAWHQNELYQSVAAVTTLEFQTRMLYQSFIADVGEKGHFELVRPFKFHSESYMENQAEEVMDFFKATRKGHKLKDCLKWSLLMVDDHADSFSMSLLEPNQHSQLTKKKLIQDIFKKDGLNIKIIAPSSNTGIIDQMKAKLRDKSLTYDIILLDYLLGAAPDQSGRREYGHDFLFALMNESDLLKGPYHRFWIFPMSSFPHAFTDKLHQLGINHLSDWWHLSNGGDPVSTPALFRFNLLEFLKQQVRVCYYDQALLADLISKFKGIADYYEWVHTIIRLIKHMQAYRDQLRMNQTSAFGSSLIEFIRQQETFALEQEMLTFLEILDGWGNDLSIQKAINGFGNKFPKIYEAFPDDLIERLKGRDKKYKIFILHSGVKSDKVYLKELEKHIKALRHLKIQVFHPDKINPGEDLQYANLENIHNADLYIILLSSDLLDVESKLNELDFIIRSNKRKVPILCRPVLIHENEPIASLQFLPKNGIPLSDVKGTGDFEKEMVSIVKGIQEIISLPKSRNQKKSEST